MYPSLSSAKSPVRQFFPDQDIFHREQRVKARKKCKVAFGGMASGEDREGREVKKAFQIQQNR